VLHGVGVHQLLGEIECSLDVAFGVAHGTFAGILRSRTRRIGLTFHRLDRILGGRDERVERGLCLLDAVLGKAAHFRWYREGSGLLLRHCWNLPAGPAPTPKLRS